MHDHALSVLFPLIRQAGDAVMDVYRGARWDERLKADASPVTEADIRGEAVILRGLAQAFPDIPVVAEEEAAAGRMPGTEGGRFFLVDALDGTREFIAQNGEFTVNIALVEEGVPVLGVVHAPVLGETYVGSPAGAFRGTGGMDSLRPIRGRVPAAKPTALLSRSRGVSDEMKIWLAAHGVEQTALCGSSLKFCRLAAGEADLYPCLGPTMEWDTAAGQAVLGAAGGQVVGLDGQTLRYNKRHRSAERDFANAPFVASGRAAAASDGIGPAAI